MSIPSRTCTTLRHVALAALVVAACVAALWNSYPWSGPVLLSVSATHGMHVTDPLFLALAPACLALLRRSARACLARPAAAYVLAA